MADAMKIEVYLDDQPEPIKVCEPPGRFELDTMKLEDGAHRLRIVATDRDGRKGTRIFPFEVRNGPAIDVGGLSENREHQGNVTVSLNAYGSHDKEWEVATAENRRPVSAWMWVFVIGVAAWTAYYGISTWSPPPKYADTPTYGNVSAAMSSASSSESSSAPQAAGPTPSSSSAPSTSPSASASSSRGAQIYSSHCADCHQADGEGVPGVFPPMKGAPAVTAKNPTEHIRIVLFGLSGRKIGGKSYAGTMPAHKSMSNQQIADVVNHERTSWGNNAPTVTAAQVAAVRKQGPTSKPSGGGS